jgi:hypothetical protein
MPSNHHQKSPNTEDYRNKRNKVSHDKVLKASPTGNRHLQWILMRLQQLEVTNQKPAAIQILPNSLECNSINYT